MRSLLPRSRTGICILLVLLLSCLAGTPGLAQDDDVVSHVNGEPITRAAFHRRVHFVRWQYLKELEKLYELTGGNLALSTAYVENLMYNLDNPEILAEAVLAEMEDEMLLWQTGTELGIIPTAEDAQTYERAFFSLWTEVPVDDVAQSPTAQTFITDWYAEVAAVTGMTADDVRALFLTEALRAALFDHFAANVPAEELSVLSRHIMCSFHPDQLDSFVPPTAEERTVAEDCIADAQAALAGGQSFADVARTMSHDTASALQGGEVGWVTLSYLAEGYANAVRDAALNTVIGPVETEYGLHLIEVLDRQMQALSPEEYETSQQGYFGLWLDTVREESTIERSPDWVANVPAEPGRESLAPDILAALDRLNR
jgi:hypothetical protein